MGPFAEFDNVASYSKYPFLDSCSLKSTQGFVLPTDFLLDLSVCLWAEGVPYLSSLSHGIGTISIAGKPVASFKYSGAGSVPVMDYGTGRSCGLVVLGPSASGYEETRFTAQATSLCPACFCTFSKSKPIISLSDGTTAISGNVRIAGENGVYVTMVGDNSLRIDVIAEPETASQCCPYPVRGIVVAGRGCPVVVGVPLQYPGTESGFVPGIIALHSEISADAVCGSKEKYVNKDGTLGSNYCIPEAPVEINPCLDEPGTGPSTIEPSNGNIDFVPFSGSGEGPSPVAVEVHKAPAGVAASSVSSFSSPDMKNLAALANSGTVVLKLKGKTT